MTIKQAKKITELLISIDIDICQDDIKDLDNVEQLTEYLEDNSLFDNEIIYYSNAMAYLQENDASLRDSLSLAADYGLSLNDISSETLANLLSSQKTREYYSDIEAELSDILEG